MKVTLTSMIRNLEKLGLNTNEAKVLDALFRLGPSGVSDIHSFSSVPRNKIYEILGRLAESGVVEVQPGRPLLYRVSNPEKIVTDLVEEYARAGEEIKGTVKELESNRKEVDPAYAWVVKGREAARRRLADLIYSAVKEIFMIGGLHSGYITQVSSSLKAARDRGLITRAVCMVSPMETISPDISVNGMVEYRTIRDFSKGSREMDRRDMEIMHGFRDTAGYGCVAIIDEAMVFNIVDEGRYPEKVTGILIRAPGAPRIQKGTIERILSLYTRKL